MKTKQNNFYRSLNMFHLYEISLLKKHITIFAIQQDSDFFQRPYLCFSQYSSGNILFVSIMPGNITLMQSTYKLRQNMLRVSIFQEF